MTVYEQLEPREVFGHFKNISQIPRASGSERQVSDYLAEFARARGLYVHQDEMANILIRKPGTQGYETSATLILHGHMDMVCEKSGEVRHDFSKDGIKLVVDNDYVRADGTSLGADNGIGVSFILALLDSSTIPHPPLEAVITVMEEMGKVGADRFDVSLLTGSRMVDFNWVTDQQILAGCAGDISCTIDVDAEWEQTTSLAALSIKVRGLLGGHCEFDIHLERANGILLLGRIFNRLSDELDVRIVSFEGGAQNNVIPAHGELIVAIPEGELGRARSLIAEQETIFKSEYRVADPSLIVSAEDAERPVRSFSVAASQRLCRVVTLLPNGVLSMSREISGLVESSSNLGTIRNTDEGTRITCTITAGVASRKHDIFNRMKELSRLAGKGVVFQQFGLDAPEFPPTPGSAMVAAAVAAYKATHNEEPEVLVSSCSLELGFFVNRIPGLDTVGIGTQLENLHSTLERVNHRSVARSWKVVKAFVERLR